MDGEPRCTSIPAHDLSQRWVPAKLTRASCTQGVERCKKRAHLIRSEQALEKIADLGKSHPFLDEEARLAQTEKARVRDARERLRQFAGRFKLPASTLGL